MIPIRMTLSGFLSYRDPVELDFTVFDLACIAGSNGAGKSSLLDAITWVLFGQARKRDDSVINAQSTTAEVNLIFEYEGNVYRVQRGKARDKTTTLSFQILQPVEAMHGDPIAGLDNGLWKSLDGSILRETDARIQQTLRLDYDTFVNASFFLQGKADQFTQQRPADRKRILSSILGLEIWESYRQDAADRRREVEKEITWIDGNLHEIDKELAKEADRKTRLKELENDLGQLNRERTSIEAVLENLRKDLARLTEQEKLVNALFRRLQVSEQREKEESKRLAERQSECASYIELVERAAQIEERYQEWLGMREKLQELEQVAERFREQEKRRADPRERIQAEAARLQQELQMLQAQGLESERRQLELLTMDSQIKATRHERDSLLQALEEHMSVEEDLTALREEWQKMKLATQTLERVGSEIAERSAQLSEVEGVNCPLCGQPLSADQRDRLIDEVNRERQQVEMDLFECKARMQEIKALGDGLNERMKALNAQDALLIMRNEDLARLESKIEQLEVQQQAWHAGGEPRMLEISQALSTQKFAEQARLELEQIDAELRQIGYDPNAHDALRQAEQDGRTADQEMRLLERGRAALAPLEREITGLESQLKALQVELDNERSEYDEAAVSLAAAQAQAPDFAALEQGYFRLVESENQLRREVGAAQQLVDVLKDLKKRRKALDVQREQQALQVGRYKQLERAFGKDGVPALLIEQALPQIEVKANEILERLSNGNMSVRFITQAAYKNKQRDDLKETLDIQISDSAGERDYEMFSGGEAFRVNFAIRLALSEVLAQRAGARLQTLVIDEGFGSQDAQGRQRLIEAINLVRADFAKILVITHIEELKDAFPTRIEVEKTLRGSNIKVI